MKIAKEFKWEMGHRLQNYKGKCNNLHGHSYKLLVELTGDVDENGMVMDYYDLDKIVDPVVNELDHSLLVDKNDTELIQALQKINLEYIAVNYPTTAENICGYFLDKIKNAGLPKNIEKVKVRIYETDTAHAEDEMILDA